MDAPTNWTRVEVALPTPSAVSNSLVLWLLAAYWLLFLVGLYGNTSVLSYVLFLTRSLDRSVLQLGDTFVFIVALCSVDSLVIASLMFLMADLMIGQWILGDVLCKLYWVLDSVNKVLSTFILSAVAYERYRGVCKPTPQYANATPRAPRLIAGCVGAAVVLLLPVLVCAHTTTISLKPVHISANVYGVYSVVKCIDGLSSEWKSAFVVYIFALGFLLPAALMATFYSQTLWHLRLRARAVPNSLIPVRRVTVVTLAITCFYFACWTPYWLFQAYSGYLFITAGDDKPGNAFVYAMYAGHTLPYVNSAFNCIFYARLNTQCQRGLRQVAERFERSSIIVNSALVAANDERRRSEAAESSRLLPPRANTWTHQLRVKTTVIQLDAINVDGRERAHSRSDGL